ncbi:NnrU family protein [Phaeobacter gallaeciensis]|uniref:NnrU protein n=1 Tax=Phaeobacter gallaeciensis TaxID=60890 RepID=A0AAC9Z4X9_9RHOB|nr:NnrU family protein [Phaeobacter gallaeciensis]AHD07971.1 putative membrane protein [Phaeobacter gallaeciensis DSM 26640]ATE91239.1 putative nnrU protein [Phaeobacter gallaeciensis]ATE95514.1 putative nnrU protein [Phaeobacter gallaeciensis]ATE99853.1 putative nnrU protein [Phaeobacter gallaeciensis]ATF04286.1 putative nnrU protein [Phaeobacter gallaeciensis]
MTNDWTGFALAMTMFTVSHFLPRLAGLRGRLIASLGRKIYFSVYGLLSLVLFGWVIVAAAQAPYVELWPPLDWTRWAPMLTMPVVFVLAVWGLGVDTPYTLGGNRNADPAQNVLGRAALSRHPLLLALLLWSLSHLLANGDLAHAIVFGGSLFLASAAILLFDAKATTALGPGAAAYFAHTALFSLKPIGDPNWRRHHLRGLCLRTAIGLLLWIGTLHLHEGVIGVSPLPY